MTLSPPPIHADLADLLAAGKVAEFNEQRRSLGDSLPVLSSRQKPLDLSFLDLKGVNLAGATLDFATLTGADLTDAILAGASLENAVLYAPTSAKVDVPADRARPTRLVRVDLSSTALPSSVRAFQYVDLRGATGIPEGVDELPDLVRMRDDPQAGAAYFRQGAQGSIELSTHVTATSENPIATLPPDALAIWRDAGVDVAALAKLRAIRVPAGRPWRDVRSADPDVVVIVEPGRHLNSLRVAGPVVVESGARVGGLHCGNVAWLRDGSSSSWLFARTALVEPEADVREVALTPVVVRPFSGPSQGAWRERVLRTSTLDAAVEALSPLATLNATEPRETVDLATELGPDEFARLSALEPAIRTMRAVGVSGRHYGARSITVVQRDPDVLLVLRSDFGTHGSVFSEGPIVALGCNAELIASRKWVEPGPPCRSTPHPRIVQLTPLRSH